jgi:hypothetical protein
MTTPEPNPTGLPTPPFTVTQRIDPLPHAPFTVGEVRTIDGVEFTCVVMVSDARAVRAAKKLFTSRTHSGGHMTTCRGCPAVDHVACQNHLCGNPDWAPRHRIVPLYAVPYLALEGVLL